MLHEFNWRSTPAEWLLQLFVIVLVLNVAAWVVLTIWPSPLVSNPQDVPEQILARYTDGDLKSSREHAYGVPPGKWHDFLKEVKQFTMTAPVRYEDYTGLKVSRFQGKYFNISEHGFRQLGELALPWPPDKETYNIFFFGDSAAMGVTPDAATIARFLHDDLNERSTAGRPTAVYNFGRPAYQSTQEAILFTMLLRGGIVPDAAIFLGGSTEFFFLEGGQAVSGVFEAALDKAVRSGREQMRDSGNEPLHW